MNTREPNNMTPKDFEESVVELWRKGFVEIYKDENGEDSIRLTGIGKKMAEELMIEEIALEVFTLLPKFCSLWRNSIEIG